MTWVIARIKDGETNHYIKGRPLVLSGLPFITSRPENARKFRHKIDASRWIERHIAQAGFGHEHLDWEVHDYGKAKKDYDIWLMLQKIKNPVG